MSFLVHAHFIQSPALSIGRAEVSCVMVMHATERCKDPSCILVQMLLSRHGVAGSGPSQPKMPKLMTQDAPMISMPPTNATILRSLATRPSRRAPSTSPC